MEKNIGELIQISQEFGMNPDYIIAGGGNSSYKDDEKMWVKASGTSMGVIDENGFVCLDRSKMQVLSQREYSQDVAQREQEVKQDLQNAILFPEGKRPSVEASMHEVIQYAYIMHTHPTYVNGVLCGKNSKAEIEELFGDQVIYIPYIDPGYTLFKEVVLALQKYRIEKGKEAQVIFLENHGVFVGADTCDEIKNIYADINNKIKAKTLDFPSEKNDNKNTELEKIANELNINGTQLCTVTDNSDLSLEFTNTYNAFSEVNKPFTPDNIVYCKSKYLFVAKGEDLNTQAASFKINNGYNPKVIAIEGKGIIFAEETSNSAEIAKDVFKDMMKVSYLSRSFGGSRSMNQEQIDFIDNWEVENYRRKISKESK